LNFIGTLVEIGLVHFTISEWVCAAAGGRKE